jgi:hypothetical protein
MVSTLTQLIDILRGAMDTKTKRSLVIPRALVIDAMDLVGLVAAYDASLLTRTRADRLIKNLAKHVFKQRIRPVKKPKTRKAAHGLR